LWRIKSKVVAEIIERVTSELKTLRKKQKAGKWSVENHERESETAHTNRERAREIEEVPFVTDRMSTPVHLVVTS